jgi:hypothetical protein
LARKRRDQRYVRQRTDDSQTGAQAGNNPDGSTAPASMRTPLHWSA